MVRQREPFFSGKRISYAFSAFVLVAFAVVGMLVSYATQIVELVLPDYKVDATLVFADISTVVCCSMIALLIFTRLFFRQVPGWVTAIPFGVLALLNVAALIARIVMNIVTCVYGHYDFLYIVEHIPSWICIGLMAATNVVTCVRIAKDKKTHTYLSSILIAVSLLVALVSDFVMAIVFDKFGWDLALICVFNVIIGGLGALAYFLICYSLAHEEPPVLKPHGEGYSYLITHVVLLILTFGVWMFIWIYKKTKYLNADVENPRKPCKQLLLCLFVPFYIVYWTYQTARLVDARAKEKGVPSDLVIITTVMAFFLPFASTAILQYKLNEIADAKPPKRQQPTAETVLETAVKSEEEIAATAQQAAEQTVE